MGIEKIRLDEVRKIYEDIKALEDISFSLYQEELLCAAGLSGSGRSVLADIISDRTSKGRGRMYADGRPAVFISTSQAQTAEIFCIWYRTSVINDISVEEDLCLLQKQSCMSSPARQGTIRMRETFKTLEVDCRLQTPVASLSLTERHTIEICRAFCAGMRVLVLDGIVRDYTQKETEYMKRLVICLKEKGISILWADTRLEIMPGAANRLAVLRKEWLAAVLYREESNRQMIDRIMIGENRKAGWKIIRSQTEPGGHGMLLPVWEVWAAELWDVSFHVYSGEVVGFIYPDDTYYREIVCLFSGEFKAESGSAWLASHQAELAGGRKNMVRYGSRYIEDYKRSLSPKLDAVENPTTVGLECFVPGVRVREKLEQAVACGYLALLDIREEDLKRPVETLSHRHQLDVALYKWIVTKARLIAIDNLFSGADILMRSSVREFLEFAKGRGIGAIYYSSNESELSSVCDRLYELVEGKVSCK